MTEMQTGTIELTAEQASETTGGSLWTWLFGEPAKTGGSFGGGGATGSW